jgi:Zn-dependent peptidase ImmA (M78 family)
MDEYGFPQFGFVEHGMSLQKRLQQVAREIRATCGQARAIPFDPRACAQHFGLTVEGTDLPGGLSGRLSFFGDTPQIEFNRAHPEARVRFTIAHELAHLCFLDNKPIFPRERGEIDGVPTAQQREERLCDLIAAELLMPAARFRRIAGAVKPSIGSLRHLKELFGVSAASLLRRACEVRIWSFGVTEWVLATGSTARRRGRRRILAKRGGRTPIEREQILRNIERVLDEGETRICRSLRNGHDLGTGWTVEVQQMVLNVTPFGHGMSRGARALVLHP